MLIYCSHKYGGKKSNIERLSKVMNYLQSNDTNNAYISPLHNFSYLEYGQLGYENELLLCEDLLTACDELIVIGETSKGVEREIALAEKLNMPIKFIREEDYV